ncbi:hypothetical protein OO012_09325 [Rhodobacteraceae bacterium KMM 6894]|nr:hypothetical protein [Rhodobacteraceae bacterium KMM 6894]
MADKHYSLADKYLLALRIIQPARVQDIEKTIIKIWPDEVESRSSRILQAIHKKMKDDNNLVPVRRGTYLLNAAGMLATQKLMKERDIDNIRMFLMKEQRRKYHKQARWLG